MLGRLRVYEELWTKIVVNTLSDPEITMIELNTLNIYTNDIWHFSFYLIVYKSKNIYYINKLSNY